MVVNFELDKRKGSTLKFLLAWKKLESFLQPTIYTLYKAFDREGSRVCQGTATILLGQYSISYVYPHELRLDSSMTWMKMRTFLYGSEIFGAESVAKNWQYSKLEWKNLSKRSYVQCIHRNIKKFKNYVGKKKSQKNTGELYDVVYGDVETLHKIDYMRKKKLG